MVNKNYVKGRSKEYRLKRKYERQGYIVLRTSGSHGFADLVAIDPKELEIIFIQSKPKNISKKKKKEIEEKYYWLNDEFMVKFIVE